MNRLSAFSALSIGALIGWWFFGNPEFAIGQASGAGVALIIH